MTESRLGETGIEGWTLVGSKELGRLDRGRRDGKGEQEREQGGGDGEGSLNRHRIGLRKCQAGGAGRLAGHGTSRSSWSSRAQMALQPVPGQPRQPRSHRETLALAH